MQNKHISFDIKIGVLGGGQLGQMMIQAAISLGIGLHILDPDPQASCLEIAASFTKGSLQDYQTVMDFGKDKQILTIEIENVCVEALTDLQKMGVKIYPQPEIIQIIQDKRSQKQFYKQNNIPTAPFVLTNNAAHTAQYADMLPAVHKLGRDGYDGKGVVKIRNVQDMSLAFDAPSVLEQMADIDKEISIIATRNISGQIKLFPVVEMVFHAKQNVVDYLISPIELPDDQELKARKIVLELVEKLGIVGSLAVEMFVCKDGRIWVNEVAPRPHNSGHHTIKANYTSQYEQHLRAILDLPLGNTDAFCMAGMVNILAEEGSSGSAYYHGILQTLALDGVYIHLYGKKQARPFRKMGHALILGQNRKEIEEKIIEIKTLLAVNAIE